MARKVFYSFHYEPDSWRVAKIRNIGTVEGNRPATSNKWEEVKKGSDKAISKWIDDNMNNRTCLVVLVGKNTAKRKWIDYEIKKAWNEGKGVVGIHIHNLKDQNQKQASKGKNPFAHFELTVNGKKKKLSSIVKCYDPGYSRSTNVYDYIKKNLQAWIEEAIKIRCEHS